MAALGDLEKLKRLFRIKKNELSMMVLNGFPLDRVWLIKTDKSFVERNMINFRSLSFNDFLQIRAQTGLFGTRTEFSSIYYRPDTQSSLLVLYLNSEPGKKVNKENFAIVQDFIKTQQYHNIILISELGLNPDQASFVAYRTSGYQIVEFTDFEFALDPTKHALAPVSIEHIPSSERSAWSQREQLQPEELPMILTSDAISKRFGAKPLDVFSMVIVGTTTDKQAYARIVRKTPPEKKR